MILSSAPLLVFKAGGRGSRVGRSVVSHVICHAGRRAMMVGGMFPMEYPLVLGLVKSCVSVQEGVALVVAAGSDME